MTLDIPSVVCRVNAIEWQVLAAIIVVAGLLLGSGLGRLAPRRWQLGFIPLAVYVAASAVFGVWPFSGGWRYDCGLTPDPNLWPILAALAFPVVSLAAYLVSRWVWRVIE